MAFSGDKTWGLTRDDIVKAALRKLGAYDAAQGIQTYELNDAALALNAIVKEWSAEGLAVWLRQRTILILNHGQSLYYLGPNPTNDSTNRVWHQSFADGQLKENTLTAAAAAAATVMSIEDDDWIDAFRMGATKPTSGSIGIRLDDDSMWWTTISAVGTDTVTLASGIPTGRSAAAGARVYTFTTRSTRPIRALAAYRTSTDGIDTPVALVGRTDYEGLTQKVSAGNPLQVCFEPGIVEQTSSALHSTVRVWPVENGTDCDKLVLLTEHYADDFDASTNNPQFPAEWGNALIWCLAYELAPEYGVSLGERDRLERMALSKKERLFSLEQENASASFAPDMGAR